MPCCFSIASHECDSLMPQPFGTGGHFNDRGLNQGATLFSDGHKQCECLQQWSSLQLISTEYIEHWEYDYIRYNFKFLRYIFTVASYTLTVSW